jgi:hypothetical protein
MLAKFPSLIFLYELRSFQQYVTEQKNNLNLFKLQRKFLPHTIERLSDTFSWGIAESGSPNDADGD